MCNCELYTYFVPVDSEQYTLYNIIICIHYCFQYFNIIVCCIAQALLEGIEDEEMADQAEDCTEEEDDDDDDDDEDMNQDEEMYNEPMVRTQIDRSSLVH